MLVREVGSNNHFPAAGLPLPCGGVCPPRDKTPAPHVPRACRAVLVALARFYPNASTATLAAAIVSSSIAAKE